MKAKEKKRSGYALQPLQDLPSEQRNKIASDILARYMAGEQVAEMAPDYGVSDVTIYALLLREHEGVWKDVQAARALARMERTLVELERADDVLKLGRARETLKASMWELERVLRRVYGQNEPILPGSVVTVVLDFSDRDSKSLIVSGAEPPC